MRPTNYFKAAARRRIERTFAFNGSDRIDALLAYERARAFAVEAGARLSACYAVPLAGPWNEMPVIVPAAVPPSVPLPARIGSAGGLALFGEGGCF